MKRWISEPPPKTKIGTTVTTNKASTPRTIAGLLRQWFGSFCSDVITAANRNLARYARIRTYLSMSFLSQDLTSVYLSRMVREFGQDQYATQ